MARYCDSQKLERSWFEWLVAANTPSIEPLRVKNVLWTLVIGRISEGKIPDPCHQTRLHYIIPGAISFCTTNDIVDWVAPGKLGQDEIEQQGYYREAPIAIHWQAMLKDISAMCNGIASKFNQPSIDATENLASEAFLQVASKLSRGKLKYTPGKAPVFNLLTTTIHRCIYSVLSKESRQRRNTISLTDTSVIEDGAVRRTSSIKSYKKFRVNIDD